MNKPFGRCVIIDDDPDIRSLLVLALTDAGQNTDLGDFISDEINDQIDKLKQMVLWLGTLVEESEESAIRAVRRWEADPSGVELAAKDRPITREDYWNTSRRSVTASFNCRPATDSTSLSQHSYGWAIDINTVENPYLAANNVWYPSNGLAYRNRSVVRPGMLFSTSTPTRALINAGYFPTAGMYLVYAGFVLLGFAVWWRASRTIESTHELEGAVA